MYSSRITTSASILALLRLLEEDVFPSLLVRQFAFLQLSSDTYSALLVKGVGQDQLPGRDEANELIALAGRYLPPADGLPHPWIRLILSLEAGDEIVGLWLLGRRDPDDAYHAAEIPIFQSLADQAAIAMSNLLQAERLRILYQLDIDRHEEERHRLALELHDSVLNQLAVLRMNVDESNLSPNFQQAYEEVVQRLREIVSDLRPPMLNYGLKLALEELAQNLMERSGNQARVTLALWGGEERYPQNIEQHLFRIVQEACENAVRHAKATHVIISAQLDAQEIILDIQDNGVGFEMGERLELDDLLIHKHFGLAGIVERASLIGAKAHITSSLKTGTHIQVTWSRSTNQTGNGMME
jgi:signal transduction histidine kinase